jgi:excisionase family DNA binding protein
MATSPSDPRSRVQEPRTSNEGSNGLSIGVPDALVEAVAQRVAALLAEQLPNRPEPYMSVEEAASYLGCKPKRIYELKAQGRIAHYRDGSRLLFRRADLDAALVRREPE